MKIGVFDSGKGGLFVAQAIHEALPDYEVIFKDDHDHVPYGSRKPEDILQLVTPIIQSLIDEGCQVIVIACNTVSTTLIKRLRENFQIPFVAMEPMVKPAAQESKSKVIAVCATPATLQSERYHWLVQEYTKGIIVLEPDCSDWAMMIEHDQVNFEKISSTIQSVINDGADIIVLGCTHYHGIEHELQAMAGDKAKVMQPVQPVIEQLKRVLERLP